MADEVSYYAIVGAGRTARAPSGLARRRYVAGLPIDEALRRDLTWQPDAAIVEWEYGEVGADLVEISRTTADQLIADFHALWDQRD